MDTFIQDDHVTIMIDTFNDERRAYQFRVNALGVQADAVNSEMDGVEDWSWDAIWSSAGRITPQGYIIEMVIPFREMRFPGGDGELTFGISAERSYPRSVRHRMSTNPRDRGPRLQPVPGEQGERLPGDGVRPQHRDRPDRDGPPHRRARAARPAA